MSSSKDYTQALIIICIVCGFLIFGVVATLVAYFNDETEYEDDKDFSLFPDNSNKDVVTFSFGTPEYATKTVDDYYIWACDVYPTKTISDVKMHSDSSDCATSYFGSNVMSLGHKSIDGVYSYKIFFTIDFIYEEKEYSQDYSLTCKVG